MSVLVISKIKGDTEVFRNALATRAGELEKASEMGRQQGCLHHRFGVGDGVVTVIDEWESPEQFEAFFSDPELQALIASMGADTSVPPEITISEAVASPDQF